MKNKIFSRQKLNTILNRLKRKNKTVVFTNGCFDILHKGHIQYLHKAKSFGDVLVVGVNSDSSVKRIKGKKRPLIKQTDRVKVLAGLASVDFITIFNDATPLKLIKYIKPGVLVKGSDWKKDNIVGRDIVESYGGEVKIVKYIKGFSTTEIIRRIKRL